jgi:hypothetical protein
MVIQPRVLPFHNNHAWCNSPNAATSPLRITILEGERLCLYPVEQTCPPSKSGGFGSVLKPVIRSICELASETVFETLTELVCELT